MNSGAPSTTRCRLLTIADTIQPCIWYMTATAQRTSASDAGIRTTLRKSSATADAIASPRNAGTNMTVDSVNCDSAKFSRNT